MAFQQERDAPAGLRANVLDVFAKKGATAALGLQITHQDVDGGGFAGTILAQKAHNPARLHREIQVLVDLALTIIVRQMFAGNHRFDLHNYAF